MYNTGCAIRILYYWPPGQCIIKHDGPTLVLLIQSMHTHMETYRLPNIFYHRGQNRGKFSEIVCIRNDNFFYVFPSIFFSEILGRVHQLALHEIYWALALGQWLISQTAPRPNKGNYTSGRGGGGKGVACSLL